MREEFLIERHGKQYVLFAGLLDEAHVRGLHSIDTLLVQTPNEGNNNTAIVFAKVTMDTEAEPGDRPYFTGLGDASPQNVGKNIAPHLIRMAETRAKARALRDAVNVGVAAFEEMGDEDEAKPTSNYRPVRGGAMATIPDPGEPETFAGEARQAVTSAPASVTPIKGSGEALAGSERLGDIPDQITPEQEAILRELLTEWDASSGVRFFEAKHGPLDELTFNDAAAHIRNVANAVHPS